MKKSVKCFLLALMALCLCASVGFAEPYSGDITISFDVSATDGVLISQDTATAYVTSLDLEFTSAEHVESLTASTVVPTAASKDLTIVYTSSSLTEIPITLWAKSATISDDELESAGDSTPVSFDKYFLSDTTHAKFASDDACATLTVSADGWSGDITLRLSVTVSTDTAESNATIAIAVDVHVIASLDATSNAFSSAYFELSSDVSGATIDPISFDLTKSATSKTVTLSNSLAGQTISFDISSDVKLLTVSSTLTTKVVTSEDPAETEVTVIAPTAGNSADVTFRFASGDEGGSFDVTVKLAVNASDSSTFTAPEIGTITFTLDDAAISSGTITSASITSSAMLSTDITSSSISSVTVTKAVTTTSTEDTGAVEFTYSTTYIKSYAIYDSTYATVTPDDTSTSGTGVFTADAGSTYYVVFTLNTAADEGNSFYVTFNYTKSGSEEEEEPTEAEAEATYGNDATGKKVNPSTLSSTVINNLLAALNSSLSASDIGDSTNGYRILFLDLDGETIASGTTIGVTLIPVSSGTDTDLSGNYANRKFGTFTTIADMANYLAIDTKSLVDSSGNDLSLSKGWYIVLVRVYGGFKASAISIAADDDEDLNGGNNYVAATTTTGGSNKGSSSGCDAGFGALALLALALPLVKKIKK